MLYAASAGYSSLNWNVKPITWRSHTKITRMKNRYIYASKPAAVAPCQPSLQANTQSSVAMPPRPDKLAQLCILFQSGACSQEDGHNGLHHLCMYCMREKGTMHRHREGFVNLLLLRVQIITKL